MKRADPGYDAPATEVKEFSYCPQYANMKFDARPEWR
jgi:hypothetical protein